MARTLKYLASGKLREAANHVPGNARQRIALGLKLCRTATSPSDLLDFGICILRALPQDSLPEDEKESYWPLVGMLEWATRARPSSDDLQEVWADLRTRYPRTFPFWLKSLNAIFAARPDLKSAGECLLDYLGWTPDNLAQVG